MAPPKADAIASLAAALEVVLEAKKKCAAADAAFERVEGAWIDAEPGAARNAVEPVVHEAHKTRRAAGDNHAAALDRLVAEVAALVGVELTPPGTKLTQRRR